MKSPEYGVSTFTTATAFPSGVHVNGAAGGEGGKLIGNVHAPLVTRRAFPPPAGTTHKCAGRGAAVTRKSLCPISNDLLCRSSPLCFGASSVITYANRVPSGDHANCCTPCAPRVTTAASPPAIGSTRICSFPSTCAKNASRVPSGDHRGCASPRRSRVNTRSAPLAVSINTSSESLRFSSKFDRATIAARDFPSGEICGSEGRTIRPGVFTSNRSAGSAPAMRIRHRKRRILLRSVAMRLGAASTAPSLDTTPQPPSPAYSHARRSDASPQSPAHRLTRPPARPAAAPPGSGR